MLDRRPGEEMSVASEWGGRREVFRKQGELNLLLEEIGKSMANF